MTRNDEDYLFETLERIRDETHENNIMLRQIIRAINYHTSNSQQENEKDFNMNVLANVISNAFDFGRGRRV